MKMNIPYEKEIVFNTKIAEITSISLEYEANIFDEDIQGDFIVSGDYKIHELSVNKEPFKYRIPFSIELTDNIIRDSIHYDIHNFTYEVIDEDTLKVNIDLLLNYEEVSKDTKDSLEDKQEDTNIVDAKIEEANTDREFNDLLEDIELNNKMNEGIENKIKDNEITNTIIDKKVDASILKDNHLFSDNTSMKKEQTIKENTVSDDSKEMVLNNVSNALNTYVTYHIHILNEGEDINTVMNKYKVSKDVINEYNNELEWVVGDKIIIPELQDE